jgi:cytochrome P450
MHPYLILFVLLAGVGVSVLRNPLRRVPGPFLARFTDLWYLFKASRGDFYVENRRLHAKYGPIVRYGPSRYSFNHPDAIKAIYGPGAGLAKSAWYDTWSHPKQWTLFADRSIRRHAENKRAYQSAYSMSTLVQYESYVDDCADLFVRHLEGRSGGEPVDMSHWLQCFAFDVIGKVTYAERLGFLDHMSDVGAVMEALDNHLVYATLAGIYSYLHPYLVPIRNFLAGAKGAGRQYVVDFTKRSMAAHDASAEKGEISGTESESMLSKFAAKNAASPDTFTGFHVLAGCVSNMVAGSDTTSLSISAIVYYLLRDEKRLAKLRDEIADFQRRGQLSAVPVFQEAQQMPYLQAVIKEAMRMHPAAGLPMERVVPEGGMDICGQFFPEGVCRAIS